MVSCTLEQPQCDRVARPPERGVGAAVAALREVETSAVACAGRQEPRRSGTPGRPRTTSTTAARALDEAAVCQKADFATLSLLPSPRAGWRVQWLTCIPRARRSRRPSLLRARVLAGYRPEGRWPLLQEAPRCAQERQRVPEAPGEGAWLGGGRGAVDAAVALHLRARTPHTPHPACDARLPSPATGTHARKPQTRLARSCTASWRGGRRATSTRWCSSACS